MKEKVFKIITTPLIAFATYVTFIPGMTGIVFAIFFSTSALWWFILFKKIKLPSFGYSFYIFANGSILHNLFYAAFSIEEPFFFLISIASLILTPVLFLYWVYKNYKRKK